MGNGTGLCSPGCPLYPQLSPVPPAVPCPLLLSHSLDVPCPPSCSLSLQLSPVPSAVPCPCHSPPTLQTMSMHICHPASCASCAASHANSAGCHEKQVGVARGHAGPSSVSLQPTAPQKPPPSTAKESQTNTKTPPSRFTDLLVLQQHWTDSSKSDLPWRYSSSKQVFSSGIGNH